jgi:hypothetical protein
MLLESLCEKPFVGSTLTEGETQRAAPPRWQGPASHRAWGDSLRRRRVVLYWQRPGFLSKIHGRDDSL